MKNKPNIVFILTDDQGAWALGTAGNKEIKTPHIDSLAKNGVRLKNFFCASPVCSPARATLLTGRIPSQHGVHDWLAAGDTTAKYEPARNGALIEYLQGQPGYTDYLTEAGYTCMISGKWHLGDTHHPQKSFTCWDVHAKGGSSYYGAPMISNGVLYEEPGYVTDIITDNALTQLNAFIKKAAKNGSSNGNRQNDTVNAAINDTPFYLSVHYTAPHSPWTRENHPAETYDYYYNNCPFKSVPDNLSPPEWVEHLNIPVTSPEMRREFLSGYYAAVTEMDKGVGRILDWLEQNKLREDTLVVFTSDNGMNMGHHGIYGKGNATYPLNMYEESVKVPFIASLPGVIPQGRVRAELLSQYDFMPTLLEFALGNEGNNRRSSVLLPGTSFVALLKGGELKQKKDVFVCDEYGPVRMIRTEKWKYVYRCNHGHDELYDLKNDPDEKTNNAGSSNFQKNTNRASGTPDTVV